ncbi:MAG TPA: ABC transporter permease [Caldimonas sp.]|nr:ABC transporter permease [Caldimonas sp.]
MPASNTFIALRAMVRKDLVLYFSNRRALVTSIAAPIIIAAFFGSLFGSSDRPTRVSIALVDADTSALSKAVATSIEGDATFDVRELSESAAIEAARHGKVRAAIVLPAGFGAQASAAELRGGAKPVVVVHYDPSQATALPLVRGLLTQHVMKALGESLAGTGVSGAPARAAFSLPYDTRAVAITSSADRPYNSYAHSFAGMGVQFILFMGIEVGVGVLLARRMGLWKRLRAAPLSRSVLLGSHILSGAITALVLLAVIYAAAMALFHVRIEGSAVGFVGVAVAFALLTSSFGLLVAALGKTPEATRGLAIFATLVMVMLGGAWVPSFIFPQWLQTASLVVPTRWAVDGLDAMTWRGLGLDAAIAPIGVLLAFAVVFALVAIWRFDWEEPRG